ncbi:ribosomal large subunit pseudouridine synthase B [Fontibacillus panacisegetis]|uniref:Pseudouridine synthase n=1 Tax=Fontibacillus panacisegetis TaxID=670482 RepID=A0A1G7SF84_9BACL|nr:ribosomal large subunit pseudouridine synthase B [Fontibacillus panacisegetis]
MERLQKIMAEAGVASRRKCEELILSGKVQVNGETVTTLGTKADPAVDEITVDGKPVGAEKKMYLVFNKPKGVITSASDPQGRKIVTDYLKGITERLYPVGRLDYDTEGLLLLTNDGHFAHMLTHPKHHVPKTYHATVKGVPHGSELDKLKKGVMLEDGMTAPAEVEYHDINPEGKESTISITIHEGRNRQVRRMFDAINHPVNKLKRISFGDLFLGNLKRGSYRHLTKEEIEGLLKQVRLAGKYNKAEAPAESADSSTSSQIESLPRRTRKPKTNNWSKSSARPNSQSQDKSSVRNNKPNRPNKSDNNSSRRTNNPGRSGKSPKR